MELLYLRFRLGLIIAILWLTFILYTYVKMPNPILQCSGDKGILGIFSTCTIKLETKFQPRYPFPPKTEHTPTLARPESLKNWQGEGGTLARPAAGLEHVQSATGSLFRGAKTRRFDGPKWRSIITRIEKKQQKQKQASGCVKWNVVTTIFAPSEAVKRAASVPGWCTVIVADLQTPNDYVTKGGYKESEGIHFLSVARQKLWAKEDSAVGEFVRATPYKHFARKNLGYLYAIQHGAQFVFDFDDDNLLYRAKSGEVLTPLPNETHLEGARVVVLGQDVFNHHQLMGASIPGSWPRGLPLESIQDVTTQGRVAYDEVSQPVDNIAVMQLCADGNPDVDAIHRLVKPLPMTFTQRSEESSSRTSGAVIVPPHAMVPYNAQATLHTAKALWALLLPHSVPGRVSDIWRGYFSQALFRALGLNVAMLPPLVRQDRNEHSYLADMDAELDLYFKAGMLVRFLNNWRHSLPESADGIPDRMEQLWIELYEREYIEIKDVKLVQLWLIALVESGYDFPRPDLSRERRDHIVLMGQFNWPTNVTAVMFWNQKWRSLFKTVVVRGPFSAEQLAELNFNGVMAYKGREDKGYYSPMENLMRTLRQYQNVSEIKAVLYVHDDALLNLTQVLQGHYSNLSNVVVTARPPVGPKANLTRVWMKESFAIHSNGWFSKKDGTHTNNIGHLMTTMKQWPSAGTCIKSLQEVYKDRKTRRYHYLEDDGSLVVPPKGQSDFLLVPTRLTNDFSKAARLMLDHKVFLECAIPTIVHILAKRQHVETKEVKLCTAWLGARGKAAMVEKCKGYPHLTYAMFHPYKLKTHGLRNWANMFDWVSCGTKP